MPEKNGTVWKIVVGLLFAAVLATATTSAVAMTKADLAAGQTRDAEVRLRCIEKSLEEIKGDMKVIRVLLESQNRKASP